MQLLFNHTVVYLVHQKSLEMSIFWLGICTPSCPDALNRMYGNVLYAQRRLSVWLPNGLQLVPGNFFLNPKIRISSVFRIVQSLHQLSTILQDRSLVYYYRKCLTWDRIFIVFHSVLNLGSDEECILHFKTVFH